MSNLRNKKSLIVGSLVTLAAAFALAQPALAVHVPTPSAPTLHVICLAPTAACPDNGTNSPTSDPNPYFTFSASPGPSTGDLRLEVLIPTSAGVLGSFGVSGTQGGASNSSAISGTAALFSTTAWTSGQLDAYLGIAASPTNTIGAFTGGSFYVYQADLGTNKLWDNSNAANGPHLHLGSALPTGAYVLAFLNTGVWGATANSGALYETGHHTVPEPATLGLLGLGLAAAGMARRKRKN